MQQVFLYWVPSVGWEARCETIDATGATPLEALNNLAEKFADAVEPGFDPVAGVVEPPAIVSGSPAEPGVTHSPVAPIPVGAPVPEADLSPNREAQIEETAIGDTGAPVHEAETVTTTTTQEVPPAATAPAPGPELEASQDARIAELERQLAAERARAAGDEPRG